MHLISHLKTKAVIILTLITISFSAYAQAPNLLNYQGVARNVVGNPLPNQSMNLRLSVHNLSANGAVVYEETRVIKTNLGGLFSVQVGSAGATSTLGTIGGVSWLTGDKYLQVEIDPASNNNYLNMGTVQLVSVPYAFNAVTAANALTVTTNANLTGAVTSNGNLTSLAASPALTGVPTAPTAAPGTNTTQIATTEFVKAAALTGPTGAKGVQGLAGADGATGPQGIPGLDGAAGAQGIQGIQGLTGSVADVAAISATSTANGASITSGSLSLAPADATNGGIVTTGDQIFAGAKTFNADLIVNGLSVGTGAGNNNTNTAIGKDPLKTNTTGRSNTANGEYSLYYNTTGNYNTANGGFSLFNNTTGEYNTANGVQALFANTEGSSNTANGKDALKANTTGSYNTANGLYALYFNKEGSFNTANGLQALFANTTGSFNTANGINAGYTNTTGDNNTFIGHGADVASAALTNATAIGAGAIVSASNTIQLGNVYVTDVKTSGTITAGAVTYPKTDGAAGQVLTANANGIPTWAAGGIPYTGANAAVNLGAYDLKVNDLTVGKGAGSVTTNSAIGHDALYSNTTGDFNTAIGRATLGSNTIGYMNTAIGTSALGSNNEGFFNTATGGGSLQLNTTGMNNTATGANALAKNTIGNNNTAQGASALYNNTTGSGNTAIGYAADVASAALTNATAIGAGAIVSASNTIQLGADGTNGITAVTNVKTSGSISAGLGASSFSGKVIVGASSAASASAILEASSTTQGFLPPRMTSIERDAIASPALGLIVYCINCSVKGQMQYFDGMSWVDMVGNAAISGLNIGTLFQGGQIAYILQSGDPGYDPNKLHGLIAATTDQSSGIRWYIGLNITTGATGTTIGTGLANTNTIISSQDPTSTSYAAGLARAHNGGSYTDWYLPSQDELAKLYAMHLLGFGGFTNHLYWSSTEVDVGNARLNYFLDGSQLTNNKGGTVYVRAIRAF